MLFFLNKHLLLLSFVLSRVNNSIPSSTLAEANSNEKHDVMDPMPELTKTSPYVHSGVDSNTFTMDNATCQSRS
jgi:hypothetical protein